jgi:hypothetical protein
VLCVQLVQKSQPSCTAHAAPRFAASHCSHTLAWGVPTVFLNTVHTHCVLDNVVVTT